MCGRFGLYHSSELLSQHFGLDFGSFEPRYNLAPTQLIPFMPHPGYSSSETVFP
jgi:putative SOS response-associated peptidase YedK